MGDATNSRVVETLGWIAFTVMVLAVIGLLAA